MEVETGVERALQGESVWSLARAYRAGLIDHFGLAPEDVSDATFADEALRYAAKVCRELGDRHGGDHRALVALRDWVRENDDYDAWDALLSHFEFEGKDALVRRGRVLFPATMTSHWDS